MEKRNNETREGVEQNVFDQSSQGQTTLQPADLCLQTFSQFMAECIRRLYRTRPCKHKLTTKTFRTR